MSVLNLAPLPNSVDSCGGEAGFTSGSNGDFHTAWVMFVQSNGIMFAVWMMTWAVSSCRNRISI